MEKDTPDGQQLLDELREAEAAEDLAAILEDWSAIHSDFDQIRMDASFEF